MRSRKWNDDQLQEAVASSKSIRQVIAKLGLVPAGGNYVQVKNTIEKLRLNIIHFTGKGWSKGNSGGYRPLIPLNEILRENTTFQSFKLKRRLFHEKIFQIACSIYGWNEKAVDGRIPLELDHINGNKYDNRLENLRILCPNCHSLQSTHRGKNKKRK